MVTDVEAWHVVIPRSVVIEHCDFQTAATLLPGENVFQPEHIAAVPAVPPRAVRVGAEAVDSKYTATGLVTGLETVNLNLLNNSCVSGVVHNLRWSLGRIIDVAGPEIKGCPRQNMCWKNKPPPYHKDYTRYPGH